jgi:hypothetical protein
MYEESSAIFLAGWILLRLVSSCEIAYSLPQNC